MKVILILFLPGVVTLELSDMKFVVKMGSVDGKKWERIGGFIMLSAIVFVFLVKHKTGAQSSHFH